MKKVLIITYYWPPSGGISVQRIAKFAKYLPDFGWYPVILTVDNGQYFQTDDTYLKDVENIREIYRARSLEPHAIYNAIKPKTERQNKQYRKTKSRKPLSKFIEWASDFVRLNFFIPDARIGWLPNAVKMGLKVIEKEKPDLIFSTAPPFTSHLIAKKLRKKTGVPWVADFRDAWFENNLYHKSYRLLHAKIINKMMEKSALTTADKVVCIGENMKNLLASKIPPASPDKFTVISNGYDSEDIQRQQNNSELFYLSYFGTFYKERLPIEFLTALNNLIESNIDIKKYFRFRVYGNVDSTGLEILNHYIPDDNLILNKPVAYSDFMAVIQNPQLLLLTIDKVPFNEIIVTGKIFDYLTSGNPVLGIGPENGDAAVVLQTTGAGRMFSYNDPTVSDYIIEKFHAWKQGSLIQKDCNIKQYERKQLTQNLASLFSSIIKND